MNVNTLFYLSITFLCSLGCYSQAPVLHAYDNLEDSSLSYSEPLQYLKIISQTDLDLSLTPSSFMKIVQENEGVIKSYEKSASRRHEEATPTEPEEECWSSFLPIWGEEACKKGHELPLPFGIAGSFFFANRDIDVDSIDIDIRNASLNLDSLVSVMVESEEMNWSVRFDTWILPFLNIYLLGGYTKQDSDVNFSLREYNAPLLSLLLPGRFTLNLDFDGTTFGGGTTLVGGYKQYYFVVDANYTLSDMEGDITRTSKLDQTINAFLISTRVGWRTEIRSKKLNIWIGGTYWGISQVIDGKVELPILGTVDFEVDQSPANPFSVHFGSHIEVTPHFDVILDVGSNFDDMFSLTPSLTYRF